ncbi:MAG: YbfB/YjiJ family MFS transporter [Rhodobiaceae bacterium]|nr:YbfB/YjiJ family MFS transporter [Rhodobiaceae bacterium]
MRRMSSSPAALALGGLVALAAAMGIGRFVYTPVLADMLDAGALNGAEAGYVAAANFAGYLAGALLAASPLLRGRRISWMFGALLASAATTAAMGLADGVTAFAVLRLAGGVASALVLVFATAIVLDGLIVAGRGGLSALHFAGVGAGIAISALLVHALKGADLWQAQWFASGGLALAAFVAALLLVHESVPNAARSSFSAGGLAADRRLVALMLAYGLVGFGYVITATFIIAIVRANPAVVHHETAVWLVVGFSAAPSVWLWGRLARRIGVLTAFAAACVVEAIGVLASVASAGAAGAYVAAVFLGGTFMGLTAMGLAAARELPVCGGAQRDGRRVVALMTAGFGVGQMFGPALAGALFTHTGTYTAASALAAGGLVVSALLAAWLSRDLARAQ